MLDSIGLDQRIWKPMLNFIAHLKRFNKVAGTLGPTWTCTNSIIQGCSFESAGNSGARLCATGEEAPKHLQSAVQITRDSGGATGTRFNPLKSTCATQIKQMEKEVQQTAEQFWRKIASFEKHIGYPVTFKGNRDRTNQNKRTDEATRTVARFARPPKGFGFEARARHI